MGPDTHSLGTWYPALDSASSAVAGASGHVTAHRIRSVGSWRSRSYARHQVRQRSHTPPSIKPRHRRARRRRGRHRRRPIRGGLIGPSCTELHRAHATGGRKAADWSGSRSRHAPSRSFVPLEVRKPIAVAPIVMGSAPCDDGRRRRSPVPARASAAGERRSDVVQRSHEADLLLAGESVDPRPGRGLRAPSTSALDDPRRGVGSQLIPGRAEHLKCLLKGFEYVGRSHVTARPFSGRMEGPRGVDQLGCAVLRRICCVHAGHRARRGRSRPWGSMPKWTCLAPHSNRERESSALAGRRAPAYDRPADAAQGRLWLWLRRSEVRIVLERAGR
jgi:hypothetical protein